MTKAERECSSMSPGFRKLVRTLRLQQERERAERARERRLAKKLTEPS